MNLQDEAQRLRMRGAALAVDLERGDSDGARGAPSLLAQTKVVSAYPTSAPSFFACVPLTVMGQEVEGGAGSISTTPVTFYALNLGTTVPTVGTRIVVTFVGNRWVFRYDS